MSLITARLKSSFICCEYRNIPPVIQVKLKFAKNIARVKDKYIDDIVTQTRAKLIDVRGHVAVIYKKKP